MRKVIYESLGAILFCGVWVFCLLAYFDVLTK
jgi:hypothetical protein